MFIGREKEVHELQDKINNDRFESILIYGRRRIGKTELIHHVGINSNCKYLYYECRKSLYQDNVDLFGEYVKKEFDFKYQFTNFKSICEYLFELGKTQTLILAIDELPYLIDANPNVVSDIRDLIDKYKGVSKIKFIVSGSYVDVMKKLIENNSETFGRFTCVIPLETFDYYDAAKFYRNYSDEDKILMYSVFGGVAFFNSLIDPNKSAKQNIIDLVIRKNAILQLEIEYMIEAETSKIGMLNSLINLIGTGVSKYTDIKQLLNGKLNTNVNPDYLLKKLIDLEIIEKKCPINEKGNKKRIYYELKDNLFKFYFRYINRNKNYLNVMNPNDFFDMIIKDDFYTKYLPKSFEGVSREFLIRANEKHLLKDVFYEIGSYTYNDNVKKINIQLDVVTLDKNGYIAYECKYQANKLSASVINEESYQTKLANIHFYKLGFISKAGFSDIDVDKYVLFELKDFYF